MQPQRVRVKRGHYRDRRTFNPIEGIIEVEIEVCSQQKHGVDSHLFVGSGEEEINYRSEDLERLVKQKQWDHATLKRYALQLNIGGRAIQAQLDPSGGKKGLVIFGTSVKGNVKSRLQLTLQPYEGTAIACLYPASVLQSLPRQGSRGWRHYEIWEGSLQYIRDKPCNVNEEPNVCTVCDLFGAPGLSSLIEFGTFYMLQDSIGELVEGPEKLYAATPGSKFRGVINFRGLRLEELGLLLIGMGHLAPDGRPRPVLFGSHKYRGLAKNLMGRIVYNIVGLKLSSRCDGESIVRPGKRYEGKELREVSISALKAAYEKFGPYIKPVDENAKALKVMRG
ncbi:MAG: hypothetical protein QXR35_04250 [Candidatus Korarchaeum sp.]